MALMWLRIVHRFPLYSYIGGQRSGKRICSTLGPVAESSPTYVQPGNHGWDQNPGSVILQ